MMLDVQLSLAELAAGCGASLRGDAALSLTGVAPIERATSLQISYVRGGKYRQFLHTTQAGALILTPDLAEEYGGHCLIHPNPYLAYAQIVALFYPEASFQAAIHPTAVVPDDANIAEGCYIGAQVVLGAGVCIGKAVIIEAHCVLGDHCHVGAGTHLHARVTLAHATEVGERCIIHSGAVLGADGFGFVPEADGSWLKIPQVGNVVVGNEVEIGANTTIDRAAMGTTRIGDGVKLDNLIQVGHNTHIGAHTVVAACTAIAGSAHIGSHCRIAGMCAIGGHIEIADDTTITAMSMVTHSIKKTGVYSAGTTVTENTLWRKNAVRFQQLDNMARRLRELEAQLKILTDKEI